MSLDDRFRRADELLDQALGLPADERAAYLDRECPDDAELRSLVGRLLDHADQASGALATGAGLSGVERTRPLPRASEPGEVWNDRYRILRKLGQGGAGVVYEAQDEELERRVAIKMLFAAGDGGARARFLAEARAAAALNHPNIVAIHDVGEHEGQPFLIMELVSGADLRIRPPRSIPEALAIAERICDALEHAHERGLVHRDLKPGNVLVAEDGDQLDVKLADLGIALTRDSARMTRTGMIAGTPAYLAPEQALGGEVDHRADLYALGVMLYGWATGRLPFRGHDALSVISQHIHAEVESPRSVCADVPAGLEAVIVRLLKKKPEDRFPSAAAVRRALSATEGPPTADSGLLECARGAASRHEWREAFEAFREADSQCALSAEDLEAYGQTALWVSDPETLRQVLERAHAEFLRAEQPADAARVALVLTQENFVNNALAVSNGWLRRAEGLLRSLPEGPVHGELARVKARFALEEDEDPEAALRWVAEVVRIAERFGDTDLHAIALQYQGRAFVLQHRVLEGLALLDEGMAMAISGGCTPRTIGNAYCNVIVTCRKIADYRRAGEWADIAVRWCESHSESPYPGICMVNQAEVLRARGAWADAEEAALRAARSCEGYIIAAAAEAHYLVGEIELVRGNLSAAEAEFREAHRRGRDPLPGLARLRLAEGRPDAASSLMAQALLASAERHPLVRARLLPTAVEAHVEAGEIDQARKLADELEDVARQYDSPVFAADAAHAAGSVRLAASENSEAIACLERARSLWQRSDMPYEEARTRVLLARAYRLAGDEDHAELEISSALEAFERLGAVPRLEGIETGGADA